MTHDVFISHSSIDKNVAAAVCAGLESAGIRCWIAPRDILVSERWPKAIANAIPKSKAMVLIFSSNSNDSEDAKAELILARESKVVILPFKIEDVEQEEEMKYLLAGLHWLDATNPPTKAQIRHLVEMVRAIIQVEADSAHLRAIIQEKADSAHEPLEVETPQATWSSRTTLRLKWTLAVVIAAIFLSLGIYFVLAAGSPGVKVPNVVAMSEGDARATLSKAGLECSVEQKENDSTEPGKVLVQNPAADKKVNKGQSVAITISVKGKVSCPNVVGVGQDQSLEIIKQASLNFALVQSPTTDPSQHGIIISQDPAAGTSLDKGTTVSLVVGVYQPTATQQSPAQNTPQPAPTHTPQPTPQPTPYTPPI